MIPIPINIKEIKWKKFSKNSKMIELRILDQKKIFIRIYLINGYTQIKICLIVMIAMSSLQRGLCFTIIILLPK